MLGLSSVVAWELSEGEERVLCEGSVTLTAFVACELTGSDAANLTLTGAEGEGPYFRLRVAPGTTLVMPVAVSLPFGIAVMCDAGEASVSLCYR